MRFFDEALDAFTRALARDRLLDDTMVVVFGDHDAGFPRDPGKDDELAWALKDRVPLFVRLPAGVPAALRGTREIAAGQTDFAPTFLALLGIDPAPLPYMGRNLLGAPDDPPVLRPYGDWLDAAHLFISHTGDHGHACYDIAARASIAMNACDEPNVRARTSKAKGSR